MSITYTGISAELKVSSIKITAVAPDDETKVVTIESEDIREIYHMSHREWFDRYGDNESLLFELFFSVAGINSGVTI